MRFALTLGIAGMVIGAGMAPALAQNNQRQQTYNNPVYAAPPTNSYYPNQGNVPYYNNSAQPLPMQQMVAGKNAPSYNYNRGTQPYNFNSMTDTGGAPMSQQEALAQRAQRDQQAQAYQQQYYQQAQQMAQTGGMGNAYNTVQNAIAPQPQQPVKTKKRLVYRESDNPLSAPPRLFNPDQ